MQNAPARQPVTAAFDDLAAACGRFRIRVSVHVLHLGRVPEAQ